MPLHAFYNRGFTDTTYSADNLSVWLEEERFPDGWEPAIKAPLGMTLADLHMRMAEVTFFLAFDPKQCADSLLPL